MNQIELDFLEQGTRVQFHRQWEDWGDRLPFQVWLFNEFGHFARRLDPASLVLGDV